MTARRGVVTMRFMNPTPTRITLELELEGDRIAGHVLSGDGSKRPFAGWLGLAAALENVISDARPVPAT
jgi:hypothetical protein